MEQVKCYLYTRVSTAIQVDGYSLDAQKKKLTDYAAYQNWVVVGEYSDEGHSGKNITGRPEFLRMLKDIENSKDGVSFVLVFKLSRFGRNAADVLSSLQTMQDYGVNLICVEDGIDSSKESGKLMISVLSAVAEIERENILIQTMEGRRQKAREGKWNGGFAPYGYNLVNGELQISEDEANVIREIYDKYVNTNMGINAICKHLTNQGFVKKQRQNNTLPNFSTAFVKGVLDNPVYCGKIAYGRRKTEKIPGKRNEFHIVKQDDYEIYDGIHEAIISEDLWKAAQVKRDITGFKQLKTHDLEHEHILSSIIKCPICGAGMYGNVNRKKKSNGEYYKEYYYYACKHRTMVTGHPCNYNKQWSEDKIDNAVVDTIKTIIANPRFENAIKSKINSSIDILSYENELDNLRKQLAQTNGAKSKLAQQMDMLDCMDPKYDRKYGDMQCRLDRFYDSIEDVERQISDVEYKIATIKEDKIKSDKIYQLLLNFGQIYDKMTDIEKKKFMSSFIKSIEIYENELANGRILKSIDFRFPIYSNDGEITGICWDNENSAETVVKLSKGEIESKPIKVEFSLEDMDMSEFQDGATYTQIKEYVLEHSGLKVSNLYISQTKRKCGLEVGECYNHPQSESSRQPHCPPEKEKAITEALRHFNMI